MPRRSSACWRGPVNWPPRSRARAQINVLDLLRCPGVLREAAADNETLLQTVRKLFADTLTELAAPVPAKASGWRS